MDQSSVGINRQRRVSGDRQILTVLAKAIMSSHFPACTPRMDATRRRTDHNGLLRRVLRITSEAIHGFFDLDMVMQVVGQHAAANVDGRLIFRPWLSDGIAAKSMVRPYGTLVHPSLRLSLTTQVIEL